ncbi:MAG TPA: hypothetical protein VFP84_09970 [Kofleriaceae bacterium]|nr:hypothetical protein [Kofleriaceae bacterium]
MVVVQLYRLHQRRHAQVTRMIIHHPERPRLFRPYTSACSGALRAKAISAARAVPLPPTAADNVDEDISRDVPLDVSLDVSRDALPDVANPDASWRQLGIERINEKTYAIDRRLVEAALAAPLSAMRGERIVPAIRDGQPRGFKLFHLMPNSALTAIGLHDGDTLVALDGHRLTDRDDGSLLADWRAKPVYQLTFDTRDGRRDVRYLMFR